MKANCNETDPYEKCAPLRSLLYLGDAYKLNNRLREAENTYKKYLLLVKDNRYEQRVAEKRIAECHMARLLTLKPIEVQFEKLNGTINYGIANYNACISGDGKTMVFTRKMKFYSRFQ
jgi:N-glycosylase/DNA lyase